MPLHYPQQRRSQQERPCHVCATVRHVATARQVWGKAAKRKGRVSLALLHADHGVPREIIAPYLESLGWRYTSTRELPRGKGIHLRA